VELLPPEGPLNDLPGALKDLPLLSEDPKLRLLVEGALNDLSLPLPGPLKPLVSAADGL